MQFTALVPPGTPVGQGEILAVAASGASFSTTVWIAASDFGIFTKVGTGYDAAAAQVWRGGPVTTALTTPVHAGEWVTLWGTGLGSADPSGISVKVAGISVPPSYAGLAPGLPGVDQINFQFPAGVPDDCYVPIAVEAGGRTGNTPSIAAASAPGPCHHRLGLSADALAALDRGGRVPVGESAVYSDVLPTLDNPALYNRNDTVTLNFVEYDAAGVQTITGLLYAPEAGCQLNSSTVTAFALLSGPPLDAGTPLVVGPGGVRLSMSGGGGFYATTPSATTYALDTIPPSIFAPGDWSVQTSGGKDIAAFQAGLRVPPPLQWTNRATISPVSRTNDLILKWDPTGYTDREWMLSSIGVGTASVICQAPATAGSITIPASSIAQLPATPTTATGTKVELLLTPTAANPDLYSVPLTGGGTIPGVATFSYLEMVWVELPDIYLNRVK